MLFVATGSTLIYSCQKDSATTPAPVPTPTPPAANVLCDGNGTNDYFPLKLNNKWIHKDDGMNYITTTAISNVIYNTYTYYKITYTVGSGGTLGTEYLRKAANGDIMAHVSYSPIDSETVYIPANPIVGQVLPWPLISSTAIRKIISTNATFTSSTCTYTNCLKMQFFTSPTATGGSTYYYKKGIGLVGYYNSVIVPSPLVEILLN